MNWYGTDYAINFFTQSDVSGINFIQEAKQLEFTVSGEDGTGGSCNVTIPRGLLDAPSAEEWVVELDGTPIEFSATSTYHSTSIYFTYNHSVHEIVIKGITVVEIPVETTIPTTSTTTPTSEKPTSGWSLWVLLVAIITSIPLSRKKRRMKIHRSEK